MSLYSNTNFNRPICHFNDIKLAYVGKEVFESIQIFALQYLLQHCNSISMQRLNRKQIIQQNLTVSRLHDIASLMVFQVQQHPQESHSSLQP